MTLILGTESCRLDSAGRFKLPIALKNQLQEGESRFVVRPSVYAECLELWTYSSFVEEMEKLRGQLNPYSIEDLELLRKMMACNNVELDNNDRLLIPMEQKGVLGDSKDIVLQAMGSYIEVWNKEKYKAMESKPVNYAEKANRRLGSLSADLSHRKDAE
ncbi:MAG: hypothetical protein II532_00545 [Bacteroidales bacterium]|nr:hypothetical protein [Bacteroidales bacterium]